MASWWEREARSVEQRVRGRTDGRPVLFETGYGPSGLPHLGTFAEVARTSFVRWAFEQLTGGTPTRLVAFSDDMDGLRSVPSNLPQPEMLAEHLGKPLCRIPDPFGTAESFSDHMIGRLRDFLGEFGFEAEFLASSTCYADGTFDEGLLRILTNVDRIRAVVLPTLQPETRERWNPFLPLCERCGRYTTVVEAAHPEDGTVDYACTQPFGGAEPCGHRGTVPVTGGHCKVGWKVDWALRWAVLGVDYEMYGKDLIESARVSSRICRIIGGTPPAGSFYELFLDEEGRKISKKIGNGIALEEWRRYAPDDAILLFLTKPPRKARRIGLPLVARSVDELLATLRDGAREVAPMFEAVAPSIERRHGWHWHSTFDFSLLVGLVGALGLDDPQAVVAFLQRAPRIELADDDVPFATELVERALRYQAALREAAEAERGAFAPAPEVAAALDDLVARLRTASFDDAEALQTLVFEVAREHGIGAREWFAALYRVLTGNPSGPRMGTLLQLLGRDRAIAALDRGEQS